MTDDRNDKIVVELVFDRNLVLPDQVLELFFKNVELLVSTICWFGSKKPPIEISVSGASLHLGGKRTGFDVSIRLKGLSPKKISPFAFNYGRGLLLTLFAPFRIGVLLVAVEKTEKAKIIASVGREKCDNYAITHNVEL